MPKAARERTVSFRAQAPHSLRFQEYPRPKASLDEQDSPLVTERGTDVKGQVALYVTSSPTAAPPHWRQSAAAEYEAIGFSAPK
jgi:hypothetical protein